MTNDIYLNLTALDFPEYMASHLSKNCDLLLASAYHGYLEKGRGLLWIDWLNQLPVASPLSQAFVLYVPIHGRLARVLQIPDGVRQVMRRYDPQTSIVIRWTDGETIRTRTVIAPDSTPPEAYERMKGRLDEFTTWLNQQENRP